MIHAQQPIVDMRDVTLSFDTKNILKNLNLSMQPQERLVIMGKSGCGKSTILRLIVGTLKPDSGLVSVEGNDMTNLSRSRLNRVRTHIGMVFQQSALISSMTVGENLAFPLEELSSKSRAEIDKIVDETLDLVKMRDAKQLRPSELSGGMKKRIGLARALVLKPTLILFDEPSAGLDPVTSMHIDELIISLTESTKAASIVVTHEMESALRIATRVVMLGEGRVVEDMAPEKFRDSKNTQVQQFLHPEAASKNHQGENHGA